MVGESDQVHHFRDGQFILFDIERIYALFSCVKLIYINSRSLLDYREDKKSVPQAAIRTHNDIKYYICAKSVIPQ